jgi:hypothetical protein
MSGEINFPNNNNNVNNSFKCSEGWRTKACQENECMEKLKVGIISVGDKAQEAKA